MRKLRILCLVLSILVPLPRCHAQTGSWAAVESLSAGTPISIETNHRFHCTFLVATDEAISCELERQPMHMVGRTLTFSQSDVWRVRVEHPTASMFAGAAIGAGTGVALGAAKGNGTYTKGGSELIGGALLGVLGGAVGRELHIVRGKTIYQK